MTSITLRAPAPIEHADSPAEAHARPVAERRASRLTGAAVAAGIALIATIVGVVLDARGPFLLGQVPFLAVGIPAAALVGASVAPSIGERTGAVQAGFVMAILTIAVADALIVMGVLAASIVTAPLATDPLTAVIGLGALWLIGLVIVGLPMLVVTTPCAVAWACIVRLLVRRGRASS